MQDRKYLDVLVDEHSQGPLSSSRVGASTLSPQCYLGFLSEAFCIGSFIESAEHRSVACEPNLHSVGHASIAITALCDAGHGYLRHLSKNQVYININTCLLRYFIFWHSK